MLACQPLAPEARDGFLRAVAASLQSCAEVGPGVVHRAIVAAQSEFFDPPEFTRAAGVGEVSLTAEKWGSDTRPPEIVHQPKPSYGLAPPGLRAVLARRSAVRFTAASLGAVDHRAASQKSNEGCVRGRTCFYRCLCTQYVA